MTRKCTSAEARREHQHTRPTSPARTERRKRTSRGARVALLCLFPLSGCPFCLQTAWGARQVDYRPAHARASLVPDHAKGTIVLPLGAQQAVSQIAKNKNPTSSAATAGVQPAHNTSRPMPVCPPAYIVSSQSAPIIVHRCLLILSTPDTAIMRHVQANRTQGTRHAVAQILRVPQDRKGRGTTDST